MNNISEKTLRILIVSFALLFFYSMTMWGKEYSESKKQKIEIQQLVKKVDSLQKTSDSLYYELFPSQIELGRFQVAYQIFLERNPKAASEYGNIISEETE